MSVQAIAWALTVRGISPRAKLVLISLANSADQDTWRCFPSRKTLAEAADCSVDTVDRCLRELMEEGVIERQKRLRENGSQTSNEYALRRGRTNAAAPCLDAAPPAAHARLPQPQGFAAPPAADVRLAIEEPSYEPSEEAAAATARAPTRDPWPDRLAEAHAILGSAVNLTAGGMHTWGPLKALCEPATGPPCAWDDVLDALRQIAARFQARGQTLNSWTHPAVKELAIAARDARLAGNPEIAHVSPEPRHSRHTNKPRSRADVIWQLALDAAEAEQRRDADVDQWEPAPLRIAGSSGAL